jgi:hypothetical protein
MRHASYHLALALSVALGPWLATGICQEPETTQDSPTQSSVDAPDDVHVTPEMWMYLHQYRRHQDPKEAIREKAEFRSDQRRSRLASQRWYGYTKTRPTSNAVPYFSSYGTQWVGLPWDHYRWTPYKTTYRFYQNADPDYSYYPSLRIAAQGKR